MIVKNVYEAMNIKILANYFRQNNDYSYPL